MASGKRSTNGKGKKGSIRPGTFILSLFIHLLHHAFMVHSFLSLSAYHSFQFTIFPRK